ncbi:hypothetical protein [Bradyrhizobium sp.]|uniref:hypothetical protein n=1 Tax=Bradyrhizobium sp. TaxID=376 RepID=UPI002630366D|nr:hypothetical protein [Bradyrhizobium sp.]
MTPEIRRIIVAEAHRRRSGHCPLRLYSLGTGETFEINPTADGFVDITSGASASTVDGRIVVGGRQGAIDLQMTGDIAFDGYDHISDEAFTGRAGGGASVTIYDRDQRNYFQYAVVTEALRL